MNQQHEETAIQVYASPVPAVVEAREELTAGSWTMAYPDLMTEEELIVYLRIPHVSASGNYRNVIENLIRKRNLPCIHACRKRLYPLVAVQQWILTQVGKGAA